MTGFVFAIPCKVVALGRVINGFAKYRFQRLKVDFSLKNAANINYYALYQDLIAMLIALETSKISGCYLAKNPALNSLHAAGKPDKQRIGSGVVEQSNSEKTSLLKQLENLEAELNVIRNKL